MPSALACEHSQVGHGRLVASLRAMLCCAMVTSGNARFLLWACGDHRRPRGTSATGAGETRSSQGLFMSMCMRPHAARVRAGLCIGCEMTRCLFHIWYVLAPCASSSALVLSWRWLLQLPSIQAGFLGAFWAHRCGRGSFLPRPATAMPTGPPIELACASCEEQFMAWVVVHWGSRSIAQAVVVGRGALDRDDLRAPAGAS